MPIKDRIELHGDRRYGEDPAVEIGLGWVGERRCAYISTDTGEFVPASYGKASRLIRLATQLSLPVVMVDAAIEMCVLPADGELLAAHDDYMAALASAPTALIAVTDDDIRQTFARPIFDFVAEDASAESRLAEASELASDDLAERRKSLPA